MPTLFDNKKARLPLEIMVVDGLVFHTFPESAKEMYGNDLKQHVQLATCVHAVNRDDSRTSVDID